MPPQYLRIESAMPNPAGRHPGMFAMLVGLRRAGRVTGADARLAEELVERSYALHEEPPATAFDTEPRAISWFVDLDTEAARSLRSLADDVVALLARHGIVCREVRCDDPGRITYRDELQVIAVPPTSADWPL